MITLDAITLPPDLVWVDEFAYTPVVQSEEYSLTGALVLDSGTKLAGRPITLGGFNETTVIDRATLLVLQAKQYTNADMTLTLHDGSIHAVKFAQGNNPIDARPFVEYAQPADEDLYWITLRFIEV